MFVLSDGARVGIGQDVTEKRASERALRRHKRELEKRVETRTEELVRKNEELQEKQQTLEHALATHERYRQLLAYEIHDTFVQDVTAAVMFLDVFYDLRSESGDQSLAPVEQARALLRKSIAGARRTISGLRPLIIDEQGLAPGIEYLVSELNVNGMDVHLEHDVRVERFAPVAEAALFRIVQEGLTNVERHSGSKFAQVSLTQGADTLRLIVRDFGTGFDPAAVGKEHFGLRGIAERARLLGGTVNVHSAPGRGTEIIVEVPVTAGSPTMVNSAEASASDAGEPAG